MVWCEWEVWDGDWKVSRVKDTNLLTEEEREIEGNRVLRRGN